MDDDKPDGFGPHRQGIRALHEALTPALAADLNLDLDPKDLAEHQLSAFEYRDEKRGEDYTYLLFDVAFPGDPEAALPGGPGLVVAVSNRYRDQKIPRGYLETTFAETLSAAWSRRFPVTLTWKESRGVFPAEQNDTILSAHHFSGRRQVFKVIYPFRSWGPRLTDNPVQGAGT